MVVFSCDACGESLRKKDVQKHYQFNCRRCESLTCVDCKKQFWGDEYNAHTQCVTDEDFKYGLVGEHKCDKGQKKQDLWISNIDDLLADRGTDKRFTPVFIEMRKFENVPRKKKPFLNWSKCTMKRFPYKVVEEAFDLLLESHAKKLKALNDAPNGNNSKGGKDSTTPLAAENGKSSARGDEETNVTSKAKKKRMASENEEDVDEPRPKKKKKKLEKETSEELQQDTVISEGAVEKRNKKFKLEKSVARVLLEKNGAIKMKKLIRKVTALYTEYCEENGHSKAWDVDEISSRVEKLLSKNECFQSTDGCVQLTESGIAKFSAGRVAPSA
ncbi:cell growth-regulating nucleolar protein [Galendromus occidentalis]|uniref:Cell growth-regulating nucleolar protein n=1 Tax=Galendromus occidentalis TaxID=34638 RepID=A0AAJ6QP68_9ACAR|nr:cell growth-regulating nucleolar protein [Galendromus occidentalis]